VSKILCEIAQKSHYFLYLNLFIKVKLVNLLIVKIYCKCNNSFFNNFIFMTTPVTRYANKDNTIILDSIQTNDKEKLGKECHICNQSLSSGFTQKIIGRTIFTNSSPTLSIFYGDLEIKPNQSISSHNKCALEFRKALIDEIGFQEVKYSVQ